MFFNVSQLSCIGSLFLLVVPTFAAYVEPTYVDASLSYCKASLLCSRLKVTSATCERRHGRQRISDYDVLRIKYM